MYEHSEDRNVFSGEPTMLCSSLSIAQAWWLQKGQQKEIKNWNKYYQVMKEKNKSEFPYLYTRVQILFLYRWSRRD